MHRKLGKSDVAGGDAHLVHGQVAERTASGDVGVIHEYLVRNAVSDHEILNICTGGGVGRVLLVCRVLYDHTAVDDRLVRNVAFFSVIRMQGMTVVTAEHVRGSEKHVHFLFAV